MTEMIEKCAEAIWQAEWARAGSSGKRRVLWSENSAETHEKYRFIAAAVIDALMEPTETMVEAAIAPYRDKNSAEFTDIMREAVAGYFRAMLSKAKSE